MLGFQLIQEQIQECEICHRRADGNRHHARCPYFRLNRLLESRRELVCPSCLKATVEVISKGTYECRTCRHVFAETVKSSEIDSATLYRVGLKDWKRKTEVRAYLLPHEGRGAIPIYDRIAGAALAVNAARRRLNLPEVFTLDGEPIK